jgi:hypothetical protein
MDFASIINHPAFWVIIAATSELIALSPLKSNSIIQLLMQAIFSLKPGKK